MIQITNTYRCNFSCEHCLFSCSPRRKEMIDSNLVDYFLDKFRPDSVNLVGGEIFFHPDWKNHIWACSRYSEYLRIVTNGSLFMTPKGNETKVFKDFCDILWEVSQNLDSVEVLVSNDRFHASEYFKRGWGNFEQARNMLIDKVWADNISFPKDHRLDTVALGRACKTGVYTDEGHCMIDSDYFEMNLAPDGNIYACCNNVGFLGNVWDSYEVLEERFQKMTKQKSCLKCQYRKQHGKES